MTKYSIGKIKGMRLKGKSLQQIADYYGVKKSTISKFLKRNNIIFWKLPKRCRYCNQVFIPEKPNHQYCCREHYYWQRQEKSAKAMRKRYKEIDIHKNVYLDRNHPTIAYKDAINILNKIKENAICKECGGDDFEIIDGNIVCLKCGLCYEYFST